MGPQQAEGDLSRLGGRPGPRCAVLRVLLAAPRPKSELVVELGVTPMQGLPLRGAPGPASPALPDQSLEQALQPRAFPQAAELARERPVRVSRGPEEGVTAPQRIRAKQGVGRTQGR